MLQGGILRYCLSYKQILLPRDFYSRTGKKEDMMYIDEFICCRYGFDDFLDFVFKPSFKIAMSGRAGVGRRPRFTFWFKII